MTLSIPNTFVPGEKASAIQVNENFEAVKDEVNNISSQVADVALGKADINGSPTETFEVDDPINDTDAVNKRYLLNMLPGGYVGQIVSSLTPLQEAGLIQLLGQKLEYNGIYRAVIDKYAALYNSGTASNIFVTQEEWDNINDTKGACGKFVYDEANNTLRVPHLVGFTEGTDTLSELGNIIDAGLPEIYGSWRGVNNGMASDAISRSSSSGDLFDRSNSGGWGTESVMQFRASRYNTIYGNSDTVQPQSTQVFYYMVIATTIKSQSQLDIDRITTDLNNKADKDLGNIVIDKEFANKLNAVGIRTVITSYRNGARWYRIWSDGWCEQGDSMHSNNNGGTVYLSKTFNNTNYCLYFGENRADVTHYYPNAYIEKNTGSFTYTNYNAAQYKGFDWMAVGFLAEGEY